jgi:excisionase family DNA binding protein
MSATNTDERETVTIDEAARILGISRASAYAAAHRGELPGVLRLGRRLVVSRRALERALGSDEPAAA